MKKLSFKFSNSQFQQLHDLLNTINDKLRIENDNDPQKMLLHLLLTDIYIKVMKKGIVVQDNYTLKLSLSECIAFFCFFNDAGLEPYTMAIVQPMCDEIHAKIFLN